MNSKLSLGQWHLQREGEEDGRGKQMPGEILRRRKIRREAKQQQKKGGVGKKRGKRETERGRKQTEPEIFC